MPVEPSANPAEAVSLPAPPPPPSKIRWLLRKAWWLHSCVALSFGVGVMMFARAGLEYADKVMMALFASWSIMFIALRFVVGPANRRENEGLTRKGVRVATNYIIKQFYQQMFFFLTPLYASSATWSVKSWNWWLAPLLLVCAVVSTMDLVFDHFVMERRWLASTMYGLAMFGVLNVLLPLVGGLDHLTGLFIAAAATPISVALLSFSVRTVFAPHGAALVVAATVALLLGVYFGRKFVPPAPLAMAETAVGHGTLGGYECLPASKHQIRRTQLDGLRCGAMLREPGGIKEDVEQVWLHRGAEVARVQPTRLHCDGDGVVYRSYLPEKSVPADPTGRWDCETWTVGGQLVGVRKFEVTTSEGKVVDDDASGSSGSGTGSGSANAAGSGGRVGSGAAAPTDAGAGPSR